MIIKKRLSKYVGVYFKNLPSSGTAVWCAKYQKKGKAKFLGHFPLTDAGEKQAREAYVKYIKSIGEVETVKNKKSGLPHSLRN